MHHIFSGLGLDRLGNLDLPKGFPLALENALDALEVRPVIQAEVLEPAIAFSLADLERATPP